MFRSALLLAIMAFAPTVEAFAQEDTRQIFDAAYFERFAPQTAIDMVSRVPGFSVREQTDDRGLGQGGVNVLINGARVTSKDTDATDVLSRTPATAVARIEIADAATLGVTGLTGQVANVILDRSTLTGNWEYEPQFRDGARPRFTNGTLSVSGKKGDLSYTLGFDNTSFRGGEQGPEDVFDGDGNLVETRKEKFSSLGENPSLTASISYPFSERTSLTFTGSAATFNVERWEFSDVPDISSRDTLRAEDEWNAEGSLELSHDVGPGTLKVIAYDRFEHSPLTTRETDTTFGTSLVVSEFEQTNNEGELIGRTEYAFTKDNGVSWELAGEVAFNFLDSESVFSERGLGSDFFVVSPDVRVEELREQISLTRGFTVGENLAVQASAAGEWSKITVLSDTSTQVPANTNGAALIFDEGSGTQTRSFARPKGFVTFAYPLSERFDLRARFERSVGQLSFGDFISNQNFQEEREQAGNRNLVPEQSWDGEIELEAAITDQEKVIFRVSGRLIEDLVDQVPFEEFDANGNLVSVTDAVGNIDSATRWDVNLEGTLETDRWGVPGGRIDFSGTYRDTNVEDPVTGETRSFSRVEDWLYSAEFRHDIPSTPYAWGFRVESFEDVVVYRFDEIASANIPHPEARIYVEHKDLRGMILRLTVDNIFDVTYDQDRTRWVGRREQSDIEFIEDRLRTDNRRFTIALSGTF
ncbi:MAG: TonB-dependent receptor plug domain-containing protein [Pseudomonadota bacterium]